jgi:hypothetical protein
VLRLIGRTLSITKEIVNLVRVFISIGIAGEFLHNNVTTLKTSPTFIEKSTELAVVPFQRLVAQESSVCPIWLTHSCTGSGYKHFTNSDILRICPTTVGYTVISFVTRRVAKSSLVFRLVGRTCIGCPTKGSCARSICIKRYDILSTKGVAVLDNKRLSILERTV